MLIRKEFRVEFGHVVRNCFSERCKYSEHGHSAVVEVFLESKDLDNAQMVMDFGLLKYSVKSFVDSLDHCYVVCGGDESEFIDFHRKNDRRLIEVPFNPSAEMLSLFFYHYVNFILQQTYAVNGEKDVRCIGVRFHETVTGYAQCDQEDYERLWDPKWSKMIKFSYDIIRDWNEDLHRIMNGYHVPSPALPQQQIKDIKNIKEWK